MGVFLTLGEAAALAGVLPDSLRQAIHDGRLAAMKRGGLWFVERSELDRYIHHRRGARRPNLAAAPA
jgi:excisionase family DNA binding protein